MQQNEISVAGLQSKLIGAKHRYEKAAKAFAVDSSDANAKDVRSAKDEMTLIQAHIDGLAFAKAEDAKLQSEKATRARKIQRRKSLDEAGRLLDEWVKSFSDACKQIDRLSEAYAKFEELPNRMVKILADFDVNDRISFRETFISKVASDQMFGMKLALAGLWNVTRVTPGLFGKADSDAVGTYGEQISKSVNRAHTWLEDHRKEEGL